MVSKQDNHFLPEQVDEQIETLAQLGKSHALPEARLTSDLRQIYEEEHEIAEQVWMRLHRYLAQNSQEQTGQKRQGYQAPRMLPKEAQPMKIKETPRLPAKKRRLGLETLVAVLVMAALVVSMALLFQWRQHPQSALGSGGPAPTAQTSQTSSATTTGRPEPPTSVTLRVNAPGIAPTAEGTISVPSGTKVTLTVIPDHSLLPFQTFTMGIYATDPNPFSELQDCTYPHTATCSYTLANSTSEQTDYRKGRHTFRAFLGNIGGKILNNSSSVTILWT